MMHAALVITLALSVALFTGIWLIHVALRDAGIIDYYWGPGFVVIGGVHLLMGGSDILFAQWVFFGAVLVWAMRLCAYLVPRHLRSHGEDGRYRAMRENGGPSYWWVSLFTVFWLQAVLLWVIAAPVHAALGAGTAPNGLSSLGFWCGIAVFAAGLAIETAADRQLQAGKAALPAGAPVTSGLWARSRHPNYLGEIVLWWGLSISAFALSGSYLAFLGPALLTLVISTVSIPLTEAHLRRTRSAYDTYALRVPALLPGFRARRRTGRPAE